MIDTSTKSTGSIYSSLINQPIALLLITGILLGFNFPLGKISSQAGISPMIWAMIVSLGVCLMQFPLLVVRRQFNWPKGRMIRYVVISALFSFIAPNLLLFSVIPHAGAGYTGLMFALSPMFTLLLTLLFRVEIPNKIGLAGIAIGFLGATIVGITRGSAPEAPSVIWIIAAMMIPVALAIGNVYRTLDWPEKASPESLAFWSHGFAVMFLLFLMFATKGSIPFNELAQAPQVAVVQMLIAGIMFSAFFRLQQKGGPVLLSQIGYVAAAVGLITATVLLGESYSTMTWLGALVVACGIAITFVAEKNNLEKPRKS